MLHAGKMVGVVEITQINENVTQNRNITIKVPSTPEGMAIAYGSLVIMAILPIFFGSYRSVRHHKEQQVRIC
jgi:minor histocompatibility antigen H13